VAAHRRAAAREVAARTGWRCSVAAPCAGRPDPAGWTSWPRTRRLQAAGFRYRGEGARRRCDSAGGPWRPLRRPHRRHCVPAARAGPFVPSEVLELRGYGLRRSRNRRDVARAIASSTRSPRWQFEEITYVEDGPIGTITLNRPHDGNMFTPRCAMESATVSTRSVAKPAPACVVITGAGDKFFCIGGRKEGMEDTLTVCRRSANAVRCTRRIDRLQKPVIAIGQWVSGGRRQRAAGGLRHHDRQGERGVSSGRAQ
jgi:hypothetical protein